MTHLSQDFCFAILAEANDTPNRLLPYHSRKQPPCEMALGQHQPVVPRVLDEPAAGLHHPLLQTGQRLILDLLGFSLHF